MGIYDFGFTIYEKGASRHPKSKIQHQKKRAPWFGQGARK
jgi:hypothetical protein